MPAMLVTSRANPRVKQLRAAFAGHARLSGGLIAIEGEHLLLEAIRAGLVLKTIFVSERCAPPAGLPRGVELIELTHEIFASAVDTQHPQGIAALLVSPTWDIDSAFPAKGPSTKTPLLLIAAALQDPGNLGTLIRSAEAFGATGVLTTPGTVSPWNQKALRASAGSVFRVPVLAVTPSEIAALKSRGLHLFAAVAGDPHTRSVASANLIQPCALIIGNEGGGLSADLLALAHARITIPTPGPVESLNAAIAGSLLLYEASRQREAALLRSASNLVPTP
jgi:RNA methyltransferase, TrmH family